MVVIAQCSTFFALAWMFWRDGIHDLAGAQFLLGLVTILVYT